MQKEQVFKGDKRPVEMTSPHFDEEWTVMAARPVVPLQEVKPNGTRRTWLKLAGAFVAAIFLGAAAALLAVGLKQQTNQPGQEAMAVAEGVEIEPEAARNETAEHVEVLQPDPDSQESEPISVPKPTAAMSAKIKSPAKHVEKSRPAQASNNERPLEVQIQIETRQSGVDRFEERRLRRVLRRQRRDRDNRQLGRIDEIFEGRRPRP
ncbi:MAG: hypothetical protein DMF69_22060 [Acidobacteria bacterium]|nr:MAG: hypothetical protein DMF69_22060 [Acidobacteriota bacterium]